MTFITIFTPTYNRAYILPRLYESLKKQSLKDFEWIIVDDGSSDGTEDLVRSWLSCDNGFPVTYLKQENGGKQRRINKGVENAKGEFFWIVDSDDEIVPNGVETAVKWLKTIENEKSFGGVAGLRGNANGIIGETFNGEFVDCTSLEKDKHNIKGDKSEIFYTDLLKKYPFPEFEGEKFVPEALVWNRIAAGGYKIRWFNEIIYITEYLPDGYTKNVDKTLIGNWKGYSLYVKEAVESTMPIKSRILIAGAYCLRSIKRICGKY